MYHNHHTLTRLTAYWCPSRIKTGAIVLRKSQPLKIPKKKNKTKQNKTKNRNWIENKITGLRKIYKQN